jgi:hypothetical protein
VGLSTIEETEMAIAEEISLANFDMATQSGLFDVADSMYRMGAKA